MRIAFVSRLHVNTEGNQITIAGSATRWGQRNMHRSSDAFVMRLRREQGAEGGKEEPPPPPIQLEPKRAEAFNEPW